MAARLPDASLTIDGPLTDQTGTIDAPLTVETVWKEQQEFVAFWLHRFRVKDQDLPDVSSDVIASVMRCLSQFDPKRATFRAFLFRIVERQAQKYHNRASKTARRSDELRACPTWRPIVSEESAINRILVEELLQAIQPEKRRHVFTAYALQDWTIEEISEAFDIGPNTARTWILRARADFEAAFKRHQAELARIGAVLLPFTASLLLSRECDAAAPPDGSADSEPADSGEPASGHSPGNGWSAAVNPPAIDVGSLFAGLVGGAAIMFALLRLVPSPPSEPIEPDASPMVVASSFVLVEPVPGRPSLPLLAEPPGALPARESPSPAAKHRALPVQRPPSPTAPGEDDRDESLIRGAAGAYRRGDFDTARRLVEYHASQFPDSPNASERKRLRTLLDRRDETNRPQLSILE